jgi:DNA-binding response OmpR family regulator
MNSYKAAITLASRKNSFPGSDSSSTDDSPVNPFEEGEKIRVLVVEEAARLKSLQNDLETRGYLVSLAFNDTEALSVISETAPNLIVTDLSLSCANDWELLKAIRTLSDAPIIGRVESYDSAIISEGLEQGMDDYVSRSIDPGELDARIRVALLHSERCRRRQFPKERRSGFDRRKMPLGRRRTDKQRVLFGEAVVSLRAGPFKIDDRDKIVTVEGEKRRLSPKEYTLLKLLVAVPGRVVSNEEIISSLWPRNSRATTSDVQQYVHLLRTKVEKNPKRPRWIKTVKGFGYRLASADGG